MSRGWVVRLMALAGCFLLANTGSAYYYFTYFNTSAPPYTPILARFDLTTLSNNTVPFFVSSAGPSAFYPGDSFPAMVSEIIAASNIWNGVSTSTIRLAYGGFFNPGTTESAPGVQIEFNDDIPPGLLAFTVPTVIGNLSNGSNGPFLPLYLSLIEFPSDYSNSTYFGGPSYSEEFFITLVHEFGHSMGLQHTLASSVMSTIDTSASTKASPLGADDVAGISLLYPSSNYLSSVGSISGIVSMNGTGVNLASVVAISSSSQAIATLTNPDGTYQINGIPPGLYYVYVSPLPPPVEGQGSPDNIFLPKNSNGTYLEPDTGFATQFYPGTLDYLQAAVIPVTAGAAFQQPVNFNVIPVSSPGIATVRTFSYVQNTYVSGAPILQGMKTTIAAGGSNSSGLLQPDNALVPGLSVGMIGSVAQINNLRPYPPGNPFIAVDVTPSFTAGPGPMHLLFSTPGNLYVRPSGFEVVQAPAPVISAVKATVSNGQPAVAIAGAQFSSSTQILFDGVPATIQSLSSNNIMIVTPPPAPAGYTAAVVAFNSDGQSSLLFNPTAPTYSYAAPSASATGSPSVVVSPSVIPAGAAVTIDVQGSDTHFNQALTTVGFGTSDVQVNQINVISSTHLTVTVTPNVTISAANITITTGLEAISQAVGSQITTTNSTQQ
jgi:Matrixin/IPT/TIG domain